MEDVRHAPEFARAAARRTTTLLDILADLDDAELSGPSELPGWSRLTIACHLRYGAAAILRMTRDALDGQETSYYPEGRDRQRPKTLRPAPHETARDVLENWRALAAPSMRTGLPWDLVGAPESWNRPIIPTSGPSRSPGLPSLG